MKLAFASPVSASDLASYAIQVSPSLAVQSRALSGSSSIVLTTAAQQNATVYYLSVTDGATSLGLVRFLGTSLGVNSKTSGQDDFNRPSGFIPTDVPYSGPWYSARLNTGNAMGIVGQPSLLQGYGDGALWSRVANTDPETDNADLYYSIGGSDYYISAYVYIPSGQGWAMGQAVGLMRLDQYFDTAHARLTAWSESPGGYSLRVDWKSTNNTYLSKLPGQTGEQLVASGVSFDAWHWMQLHVKNSATTGAPGVVQVWLDGALAYERTDLFVFNRVVSYAEFGIMHLVTPAPPAVTVTDQVRLGTTYQQPSLTGPPPPPPFDLTPPAVSITAPAEDAAVQAGTAFTADASDDTGVARVDFLVDGAVIGTDGTAPYEAALPALNGGGHVLTAKAYDTSGNVATSAPVNVVFGAQPFAFDAVASPAAFSPNGDGYDETTTLSLTTAAVSDQLLTVRDAAGAVVTTLLDESGVPAGTRGVTWDGTTQAGSPAPDGTYTLRVTVNDPASGATSTKDVAVLVDRVLTRLTRTPAVISPNGDKRSDSLSIGYTLLGSATVAVRVENQSGTTVRTLQAGSSQTAGTYTGIVWNGRNDAGSVVPQGTYTIRALATNGVGTISMTATAQVDLTRPVVAITSVSPDPWQPVLGLLTSTLTVDSPGTLAVKYGLQSKSGNVASFTYTITAPGTVVVFWDGRKSTGAAAAAGTYEVRAYFEDTAGNRTSPYPVRHAFTLVR